MPTSSEIWNQIQGNQAILDEYLGEAGTSSGKFQDAINEKVKYNKGAIENAADLEAGAYAMPKELMNQYDTEFGGALNLNSMDRIGSLLKNLGMQFGKSNTAWGVVDNAKLRQEELLAQMNARFQNEMQARQQKHNNLLPIWQQLYAAENTSRGGGGGDPSGNWFLDWVEENFGNNGDTARTSSVSPMSASGKMADSLKQGTFRNDYMLPQNQVPNAPKTPMPPSTPSNDFNRLVNNRNGVRTSFPY